MLTDRGGRSGGAALVVAIEAAGLRHLDDGPVMRSQDGAWLGAVNGERAVTAPAVVVEVVGQQTSQMPLNTTT